MRKRLAPLVAALGLGIGPWSGTTAAAQSYPIDCAILLCLSGGWPTSVPCALARAEFIRRITPWPIEPPLQIWRCPMGAAYPKKSDESPLARLYDAMFDRAAQATPAPGPAILSRMLSPRHWPDADDQEDRRLPKGFALQLAQGADIDISGPEFNFVRSIRVYDVRYAGQYDASEAGCVRSAAVYMGSYSTQGAFSWARSSPEALPAAHVGLETWGMNCPDLYHRSVFVDWRDYEGNYGFEQVNY